MIRILHIFHRSSFSPFEYRAPWGRKKRGLARWRKLRSDRTVIGGHRKDLLKDHCHRVRHMHEEDEHVADDTLRAPLWQGHRIHLQWLCIHWSQRPARSYINSRPWRRIVMCRSSSIYILDSEAPQYNHPFSESGLSENWIVHESLFRTILSYDFTPVVQNLPAYLTETIDDMRIIHVN